MRATDGRRTPMRAGRALRTAALLLGGTLAACSPSTDQVERALESELERLVGPADRYDVEIHGLRAGDGEADRLLAVGEGVRPANAPAVDRITLELLDVRYDRERKRLERIGSARANATITASDLASFLERQGSVQDADVRLVEPDRAVMRLRPDLGGLPLPPGVTADVSGRFVGDGSHIRFEVDEVRAAGLGLGERGISTLSRLINPLVDLSEMPIAFEVTDVRVEGGRLVIDAVGDGSSLVP